MTREEQIEKAAVENFEKGGDSPTEKRAFVEGANWADSNRGDKGKEQC